MSIGIVAACHAALNSVWSFYLLRFLLGACEAGVWPGIPIPLLFPNPLFPYISLRY